MLLTCCRVAELNRLASHSAPFLTFSLTISSWHDLADESKNTHTLWMQHNAQRLRHTIRMKI